MNEAQSGGEQFPRTNEPAIEFLLHPIMSPTVLAKLRQLDEGSNLDLKDREISTTRAGVTITLIVGTPRGDQVIPGFGQIHTPVHVVHPVTILPKNSFLSCKLKSCRGRAAPPSVLILPFAF